MRRLVGVEAARRRAVPSSLRHAPIALSSSAAAATTATTLHRAVTSHASAAAVEGVVVACIVALSRALTTEAVGWIVVAAAVLVVVVVRVLVGEVAALEGAGEALTRCATLLCCGLPSTALPSTSLPGIRHPHTRRCHVEVLNALLFRASKGTARLWVDGIVPEVLAEAVEDVRLEEGQLDTSCPRQASER